MQSQLFKPGAAQKREAEVSKAIQQYLDFRGIYNDRINSGKVEVVKSRRDGSGGFRQYKNWLVLAKEGTPDRFFIVDGKIYFVEVKRRGGKPKPVQVDRHRQLAAAGAVVIIADSLHSFTTQFTQLFRSKING